MLQARIIAVLASLLLIGGSIVGAYFKGRIDEGAHCDSSQLTAELEGVDRHDSIERGVMGMDSPSLDRSLSKWLRPE